MTNAVVPGVEAGLPSNAVGVSATLPLAHAWPDNVRTVSSDVELREALVQAGAQTVRMSAVGPLPPRDAVYGTACFQVIVDYSAAWCEKCKVVEPVLASLGEQARGPLVRWQALSNSACCALQHTATQFIVADADFLPVMAADVRYTPTFAFYQQGKKARAQRAEATNELDSTGCSVFSPSCA